VPPLWRRQLQITGSLREQLAYHDPGRPTTLAPVSFFLAGKYRLRLKAGNGQVVATSEACETKPPPERLRVPFNRAAKRGNGRRSRNLSAARQ